MAKKKSKTLRSSSTVKERKIRIPKVKICFIILLIISAFLLFHETEGDPLLGMSWSAGPFSDEAFWAAPAINKIYFGSWKPEGNWPRFYLTSFLSIIQYSVFKVIGVSFFSARLISILSALGLIFIYFSILRKENDELHSFIGCLIFVLCIPFYAYGKLALLEFPMFALVMTGLLLILKNNKYLISLGGSLMVLAAMGIKAAASSIVLVTFISLLWDFLLPFNGRREARNRLVFFLSGAFATFILYLFILILPDYQEWKNAYLTITKAQPMITSIYDYIDGLRRIGTFSLLAQQAPAQMILGYLALGIASIYSVKQYGANLRLYVKWSILMLLLIPCYLSLNTYCPLRYEMMLLLPMPIVIIEMWKVMKKKNIFENPDFSLLHYLILLPILAIVCYTFLRFTFAAGEFIPQRYMMYMHDEDMMILKFTKPAYLHDLISLIAAILILMFMRKEKLNLNLNYVKYFAGFLFLVNSYFLVIHISANNNNQQFSQLATSREVAEIVGNKKLGASWSALPGLSNKTRFVLHENGISDFNSVSEVDYFLVDPKTEEGKYLMSLENADSLLVLSQFMVGKIRLFLLKNISKKLRNNPEESEFVKACLLFKKKNYLDSYKLMSSYASKHPDLTSIKLIHAELALINKQYLLSAEIASEIIKHRSKWTPAYTVLAWSQYMLQMEKSANENLMKAIYYNFLINDPKYSKQISRLIEMIAGKEETVK
ncbi:MAG: hypothetical protein JXA60_02785 [Candidatus Coatesbacteria bacterium]|nr:hypothetical protein [Candidatus Coatesbacteria bacterium]